MISAESERRTDRARRSETPDLDRGGADAALQRGRSADRGVRHGAAAGGHEIAAGHGAAEGLIRDRQGGSRGVRGERAAGRGRPQGHSGSRRRRASEAGVGKRIAVRGDGAGVGDRGRDRARPGADADVLHGRGGRERVGRRQQYRSARDAEILVRGVAGKRQRVVGAADGDERIAQAEPATDQTARRSDQRVGLRARHEPGGGGQPGDIDDIRAAHADRATDGDPVAGRCLEIETQRRPTQRERAAERQRADVRAVLQADRLRAGMECAGDIRGAGSFGGKRLREQVAGHRRDVERRAAGDRNARRIVDRAARSERQGSGADGRRAGIGAHAVKTQRARAEFCHAHRPAARAGGVRDRAGVVHRADRVGRVEAHRRTGLQSVVCHRRDLRQQRADIARGEVRRPAHIHRQRGPARDADIRRRPVRRRAVVKCGGFRELQRAATHRRWARVGVRPAQAQRPGAEFRETHRTAARTRGVHQRGGVGHRRGRVRRVETEPRTRREAVVAHRRKPGQQRRHIVRREVARPAHIHRQRGPARDADIRRRPARRRARVERAGQRVLQRPRAHRGEPRAAAKTREVERARASFREIRTPTAGQRSRQPQRPARHVGRQRFPRRQRHDPSQRVITRRRVFQRAGLIHRHVVVKSRARPAE